MAVVQPVDVAATLTAIGTITAVVVGARATRPRQTTPSPPAPDDELMGPDLVESLAKIRERVAALETTVGALSRRLDAHAEDIALLRAVEVALEEIRRTLDRLDLSAVEATAPRPRRGRG